MITLDELFHENNSSTDAPHLTLTSIEFAKLRPLSDIIANFDGVAGYGNVTEFDNVVLMCLLTE